MKTFLKKVFIIFFLVVIVGLLFLLVLPYNKQYGYYSLSGSYTKGSWIYDRIFTLNRNIDIAFIGTSRTFNSVQDSLIERKLSDSNGTSIHVANLGIPHSGRNLQYVFTNDLLEHNNPSLVVYEVREREAISGHFAFPFIANGPEIALPKSILNERMVDDWVEALKLRLEYISGKKLSQNLSTNPDSVFDGLFGFRENHKRISDKELFRRKKYYQNRNKILEKKLISNLAYHYNRAYIKAIGQSFPEGSKVVFLYLPGFQTNKKKPYYYDFYKQFGEVWIPPDSLINKREYFANYTHFNLTGSTAFSNWLVGKIQEEKTELIATKPRSYNSAYKKVSPRQDLPE